MIDFARSAPQRQGLAAALARHAPEFLARPLRRGPLALATALVLIAGAAYCSGYEALLTRRDNWPASLLWAAYGLLPWLFLFEFVKRAELSAGKTFSFGQLGLLVLCTGVISLGLEWGHHALRGDTSLAIALPTLRRLPGAGVVILLIVLYRQRRESAAAAVHGARALSDADQLRDHAPAIDWIRAADNYLELHVADRVLIRRVTMRAAETVLAPLGFVRVHRSVLVNRNRVAGVARQAGRTRVAMRDGTVLTAGRTYENRLRDLA